MAEILNKIGNVIKWIFIFGGSVTAITAFCLSKMKPNEEDFKKKLSSRINRTNSNGTIKKIIDKGIELCLDVEMDFDYKNWIIASTMTIKTSDKTYGYIGIMNNWIPLTKESKLFFPQKFI